MNEDVHTGRYPERSLVFVHSRFFKPPADEFMDISVAALRAGMERDYPEVIDLFQDA